MTKLLLLDLDGTVRRCKSNPQGFINDPKDQELIEGVEDAIINWPSEGWIAVGISNQAGVVCGHKTLEDCFREQQYTLSLCPWLNQISFCPDWGDTCWDLLRVGKAYSREDLGKIHEELKGTYRKPQPGMLLRAMRQYGTLAGECIYVGDRAEDEQAAAAAGVRFIWADEWRGSLC